MKKIDMLNKMAVENPHNPTAWFLLGLEYKELGQNEKAFMAFSNALVHGDDALKKQILHQQDLLSSAPTTEPESPASLDLGAVPPLIYDTGDTIKPGNPNLEQDSYADTVSEDVQFPVINFMDVGGLDKLKKIIHMKIIKPFVNPELFKRFKKKIGGGILLYGPPGCGKTFIARATAGECGAQFIPVYITDILDPYIGKSERNLNAIFFNARSNSPSVLFFDEIDAIGYNRAKSSSSLTRPLVDQMLSEMEGVETSTDRLLILGATNMPWDLDPAFRRPGRFDRIVFVPPPDEKAREIIFRLKMEGRPCHQINFAGLAAKTTLYSGADIENVIEEASEAVLGEIIETGVERPIQQKDLDDVLKDSKPSTINWLKTIKNYIKYANHDGMYNDVADYLSTVKKLIL